MTAKELYDYILTRMTAEEALMKMISGQVEVYNNLKQNKPVEEGSVNPIYIISAAALDMGWSLALEDNENVEGLVVGTDEYLKRQFAKNPTV